MLDISRRSFLVTSSAALTASAAQPRSARAALDRPDGGLPPGFPSQEPDVARLVVLKAHTDYDAVRELVTPRPALAKAAWDWGFGDWESALGAASHMGRRDIAELLMDQGARPNLFTFAMLDQVDAVRAICEANPGIQALHGPHGITLLQHARNGKADRVAAYLEQLGGADVHPTNLPLDEQEAQAFIGDYEPDADPAARFHVGFHQKRKGLTFKRGNRVLRFLLRETDTVFNPVGAPRVRIEFQVEGGNAAALSITDGNLRIPARRVMPG
jgi:hypothetical protein